MSIITFDLCLLVNFCSLEFFIYYDYCIILYLDTFDYIQKVVNLFQSKCKKHSFIELYDCAHHIDELDG